MVWDFAENQQGALLQGLGVIGPRWYQTVKNFLGRNTSVVLAETQKIQTLLA